MTHSKDISEILGGIMGSKWYIEFTLKFNLKFLFGEDLAIWTQPGTRLTYLISHDLIYIFEKKELSS